MRARGSTGAAGASSSSSSTPRSAARRSSMQRSSSSSSRRKPTTTATTATAASTHASSPPSCLDVATLQRELGVGDDYMVLGIDEAGRGPVLGPMVYTGAVIALGEYDALRRECGVADSKTMDAAARVRALSRLRALATFRSFTVVLSADAIARAMYPPRGGRSGSNLNTLSHDTAMRLVHAATLACTGKLCAAYVDTVGPPESYARQLCGRFPHLRIIVAPRADSAYAIVSAASIVAKVTRDAHVRRLLRPRQLRDGNNNGNDDDKHNNNNDNNDDNDDDNSLGSGYPSDPKTVAWLRCHVHRFFVFRRAYDFVRHSWAPVVALARDARVCVPVVFAHELDDNKDSDNTTATTRKRGRGANDAVTATTAGRCAAVRGAPPSLLQRCSLAASSSSSSSLWSSSTPSPPRHAVYTHLLRLRRVVQLDDV